MSKPRGFVTVAEFLEDLGIARSTFDEWRAKGTGPTWFKLPNGQLRCRRAEFERWLTTLEAAA
jgi:predicted DNA-binding transcriptional regulator AlpA